MRLEIQVPGSTSNLGPGFDCLGLALDPELRVEMETRAHAALEIDVTGPEAGGLPTDAGNLIFSTIMRVMQTRGRTPPGLRMRVHNAIPVARGLGSSAAAIVAGVVAARHLCGDTNPRRSEIVEEAAALEGHPDNVAPAVLGGLVVAAWVDDRMQATPLPFPSALEMLLVIPDHPVSTREARRALPDQVPLKDAVFNVSRVATLCAALWRGDLGALRIGMQDRLHQRLRLTLVPGLAEALESLLLEPECLAATISGSGPTLVAFYAKRPAHAGRTAAEVLARRGVAPRLRATTAQARGATWRLEQAS
jgi:homoserine kinase